MRPTTSLAQLRADRRNRCRAASIDPLARDCGCVDAAGREANRSHGDSGDRAAAVAIGENAALADEAQYSARQKISALRACRRNRVRSVLGGPSPLRQVAAGRRRFDAPAWNNGASLPSSQASRATQSGGSKAPNWSTPLPAAAGASPSAYQSPSGSPRTRHSRDRQSGSVNELPIEWLSGKWLARRRARRQTAPLAVQAERKATRFHRCRRAARRGAIRRQE